MDIDVVKYHSYHAFQKILRDKYKLMRDDGFEIREPSDVFKLFDGLCDALLENVNLDIFKTPPA